MHSARPRSAGRARWCCPAALTLACTPSPLKKISVFQLSFTNSTAGILLDFKQPQCNSVLLQLVTAWV